MSSSTSWNAWRLACLPYLASITGRSIPTASSRHVRVSQNIFRPRVRHVSCSPQRRIAAAGLEDPKLVDKNVEDRKAELSRSEKILYPRLTYDLVPTTTIEQFLAEYKYLKDGEKASDGQTHTIAGRISNIRKASAKLVFVDIVERVGQRRLQLLLDIKAMNGVEQIAFMACVKLIRRGDIVTVTGTPSRTASGQLSLYASKLPELLSPSLHIIPDVSADGSPADLDVLDRHVEMLTTPAVIDALVIRSRLLSTMRDFFKAWSFEEVQTPILAAAAGGATARPFETVATEFTNRKLALRVAPELWLKRLILGGMSRVFEIGPSFRNEGLDKTHNPEFTTCEFYATYTTLDTLQRMTEEMFRSISAILESSYLKTTSTPSPTFFNGRFAELDFIPAINDHLTTPLPNLSEPETAIPALHSIFKTHNISLPPTPTLPRLLDKLCAHFLEPKCIKPTWIINTPSCLSPLAKSFIHPSAPNNQLVAARAELFIDNREIVNCYEEENSPTEQRRKFIEQRQLAHVEHTASSTPSSTKATTSSIPGSTIDHEAMPLDESYLRALEWGLPPTGGWGCGIDRLVMFFTGRQRIGDVLSFGSLRAVTRGAERSSGGDEVGGEAVDTEVKTKEAKKKQKKKKKAKKVNSEEQGAEPPVEGQEQKDGSMPVEQQGARVAETST